MRDPGKVMQQHFDLQKESSIGVTSKMIQCATCRKRKSVGQFRATSTNCLQCARRAPRGNV